MQNIRVIKDKKVREVRTDDLELGKEARFILTDRATEKRYEVYMDSGHLFFKELGDDE